MAEQRPPASGVIRLAQDNARKVIEIVALSPGVAKLLKAESAALMGRDIRDVVATHVRDSIEDYVEFTQGGTDISEVLGKVRKMALLDNGSREVAVNLKVQAMGLDDVGRPLFDMIMRSAGMDEMRGNQTLARNMALKGHEKFDATTGLPDKESFQRDIELVVHFLRRDGGQACVAAVILFNYADVKRQRGEQKAEELMKKVAETCRIALRSDDSLARLDSNALGILLLDADRAAAPFALNRLRNALSSVRVDLPDGLMQAPELSFSLTEIQAQDSPEGLMQATEKAIAARAADPKPGQFVEMRAA